MRLAKNCERKKFQKIWSREILSIMKWIGLLLLDPSTILIDCTISFWAIYLPWCLFMFTIFLIYFFHIVKSRGIRSVRLCLHSGFLQGKNTFLSKEMMLYRIRNNQFIRGTCPPLILYTKKNLLYIKSRDICYYWSMTFFSHVQIHPTSDGGSLFFKKIAEL